MENSTGAAGASAATAQMAGKANWGTSLEVLDQYSIRLKMRQKIKVIWVYFEAVGACLCRNMDKALLHPSTW